MRIVHISACSPYNNYWGYQENLLPKYQKKLGHEVFVIVSNKKHQNGEIIEVKESRYYLDDGVLIIRRRNNLYFPRYLSKRIIYMKSFDLLCEFNPDLIFIHGLGHISSIDAIKYKKKRNANCIIVADNHGDYLINKASNKFKYISLNLFYKGYNQYAQKYYDKVFGVTPLRKKYAEEIYGIKSVKTDLLLMGADVDKINFDKKDEISKFIRNQYNLGTNDFVVITGGKFDTHKNIGFLLETIQKIPQIKLLVFGSFTTETESIKNEYKNSVNINFVGWLNSSEIYNYFLASNLAVFPGRHSVLWEQAVACGIPCVFQDFVGMHHVDVGGNCIFLNGSDENELYNILFELKEKNNRFNELKSIAEKRGTKEFSYLTIANNLFELIKEK
ncbi:MAG: glycosyltransferase family 4 protein [Pleomorphochaeta sp.]